MGIKTRNITKGKGHFLTIKEAIYQGYITIINIYASNNKALKHMKAKLSQLKEKHTI